jgi:plasmid stabilization system protein ParE
MFEIQWSDTAESTYADEIDFILQKWNIKEVEKFIALVEEFLGLLSTGKFLGKRSEKKDIYLSIISKQTSLAYKIDQENKVVSLVTFFNNKKNPKEFSKLLKK